MTTICLASLDGTHALAADGRSLIDNQIIEENFPKLIAWGPEVVVAASGYAKIDDLIRTAIKGGAEPPPSVTEFASLLKGLMDAAGWKVNAEEGPPNYSFTAAYLSSTGLWAVFCDFSTRRITAERPFGFGSGGDYAMGAMMARARNLPAVDTVRLGVEVAKSLDANSGGGTMAAVRGERSQFGPAWVNFASKGESRDPR